MKKIEVLLKFDEPIAGAIYQLKNGDRYIFKEAIERLDHSEKVVLLWKILPEYAFETKICSLKWFLDGRFKRVYSLSDDLDSLEMAVDTFLETWCYWANKPEQWKSTPKMINSVPEICQRMKTVLAQVRSDREFGANSDQ